VLECKSIASTRVWSKFSTPVLVNKEEFRMKKMKLNSRVSLSVDAENAVDTVNGKNMPSTKPFITRLNLDNISKEDP
jgi:hypothetical protein